MRPGNLEKVVEQVRPRRRLPIILGGFLLLLILASLAIFAGRLVSAARRIVTPNIGGGAPYFLPKIGEGKLRGEGDGRVNILLLGIPGSGQKGPNLSDAIEVVSIDPEKKQLALLSIPRDLAIPIKVGKLDFGLQRINHLHALGEERRHPGGGPALAKEVISALLDLPIHYYVRVDFKGFSRFIDEIGGVRVVVPKAINDPFYPAPVGDGYEPFSIAPGVYEMDGELALKYVRSRETSSDFDRSRRQQDVLQAIAKKVFALETLANPRRLLRLAELLAAHLRTDIQPWELERLAKLLREVDMAKTKTVVLDTTNALVADQTSGAYLLYPKGGSPREIRRIAHEIFREPSLEREQARIEIRNGTKRTGLAASFASELRELGYTIVRVENSGERQAATLVIDYSAGQKSETLAFLRRRLGQATVQRGKTGEANVDLLVILGEDFRPHEG